MKLQRFGHQTGGSTADVGRRFDWLHTLHKLVCLCARNVIKPCIYGSLHNRDYTSDSGKPKRLDVEKDPVPRHEIQRLEQVSRPQRVNVNLTTAIVQTKRKPIDLNLLKVYRLFTWR